MPVEATSTAYNFGPVFLVPLSAGIVGAVFSIAVLRQYLARRRPYQAVWAAALAMFGVAALLEAAGVGGGWTPAIYKGYYLFGALLNVGWLAVGTVYLLAPPRAGHGAAAAMGIITLLSIAAVAAAAVDPNRLHTQFPNRASDVPAVFPALINSVATVVLVGGAAWSAYRAFRRQAPPARVLGTALIAAGALVVGADHSIAQLTGLIVLQPLSEALGIAIMFAGYLAVESRRSPVRVSG